MKYNETEHEVLPVSMNNLDHVRSITTFGPWDEMLNQVNCQALRVLDSVGWCPSAQVKFIGHCCQLRYLDLSCTDITSIPEEIGKLQNLETLDVSSYSIEGKLPATIYYLVQLAIEKIGSPICLFQINAANGDHESSGSASAIYYLLQLYKILRRSW